MASTFLSSGEAVLRLPASEMRNYSTLALLRLLALVLIALGIHILDRFRGAAEWYAQAVQRQCQRNALASLDDRLLKDLGLTRWEAEHESEKPVWKV